MRTIGPFLVAVALCSAAPSSAADHDQHAPGQATFTLWQLPEQTHSQMMSYVIRGTGGKLIVIDGGTAGDAPYLRGFLAALGNNVQAWFVTHPHSDHVGALGEILPHPQGLTIGSIYASMPDSDWVAKHIPRDEIAEVTDFEKALKAAGRSTTDLAVGQILLIDGIRIEVLGIKNPEFTQNALNNSSVVLRVSDKAKTVLFLGDLGVEAGEKLLRGTGRDRLRADYVQMAHHGQNGVGKDVYRAIRPSYCLWPTPRWLWNNDAGKGIGTGPWRTLEVRAWMAKLSVTRHYVSADGLYRIE
jgi:beta-lactamase superfamily II metal-dependent hydrolase